jgi:hypothetical protein
MYSCTLVPSNDYRPTVQSSGNYPRIIRLLRREREMFVASTWAVQIRTGSGLGKPTTYTLHEFSSIRYNKPCNRYGRASLYICVVDSVFLYGFGIFVTVRADISETPTSCTRRQRDFQGDISNLTQISSYFSSVSIRHIDSAPALSNNDPVCLNLFNII